MRLTIIFTILILGVFILYSFKSYFFVNSGLELIKVQPKGELIFTYGLNNSKDEIIFTTCNPEWRDTGCSLKIYFIDTNGNTLNTLEQKTPYEKYNTGQQQLFLSEDGSFYLYLAGYEIHFDNTKIINSTQFLELQKALPNYDEVLSRKEAFKSNENIVRIAESGMSDFKYRKLEDKENNFVLETRCLIETFSCDVFLNHLSLRNKSLYSLNKHFLVSEQGYFITSDNKVVFMTNPKGVDEITNRSLIIAK